MSSSPRRKAIKRRRLVYAQFRRRFPGRDPRNPVDIVAAWGEVALERMRASLYTLARQHAAIARHCGENLERGETVEVRVLR